MGNGVLPGFKDQGDPVLGGKCIVQRIEESICTPEDTHSNRWETPVLFPVGPRLRETQDPHLRDEQEADTSFL